MVFWFCEIVWLCLGLIVEFCFWVIIGGRLIIIDGGLVISDGGLVISDGGLVIIDGGLVFIDGGLVIIGLLVIELVLPAKRPPYLSSLPSHITKTSQKARYKYTLLLISYFSV